MTNQTFTYELESFEPTEAISLANRLLAKIVADTGFDCSAANMSSRTGPTSKKLVIRRGRPVNQIKRRVESLESETGLFPNNNFCAKTVF